jgi:hypothetical protein
MEKASNKRVNRWKMEKKMALPLPRHAYIKGRGSHVPCRGAWLPPWRPGTAAKCGVNTGRQAMMQCATPCSQAFMALMLNGDATESVYDNASEAKVYKINDNIWRGDRTMSDHIKSK